MLDSASELLPDDEQQVSIVKQNTGLVKPGSYVELRTPEFPDTKQRLKVTTKVLDHHLFGYWKGIPEYGHQYGPEALEHLTNLGRFRIAKKFDCVFMNTGEERTGKTNYAIQQAQLIDPDIPLERICFKIKQFNAAMKEAKPGEVVMFDEAGFDLFGQEWYNEFQKSLNKKLQVVGKRRVILILNLPHKDLLNAGIRNRRIKYWTHVYTEGEQLERGFAEVCEAHGNKWYTSVNWRAQSAFKYPELKGNYWTDYEKLKDEFIQEVEDDSYVPEGGRTDKLTLQRNLLIAELIEAGRSQGFIAKKLGISQSAISQIVSKDALKASF